MDDVRPVLMGCEVERARVNRCFLENELSTDTRKITVLLKYEYAPAIGANVPKHPLLQPPHQ